MTRTDPETIDLILEAVSLDERELLTRIGEAVAATEAHFLPPSVMDLAALGRVAYESIKADLQDLLCSKEAREPKPFVKALLHGELRNLAVGILSAISGTYNVAIGIAVPVVAMILKSGVATFCRTPVRWVRVSALREHEPLRSAILRRR